MSFSLQTALCQCTRARCPNLGALKRCHYERKIIQMIHSFYGLLTGPRSQNVSIISTKDFKGATSLRQTSQDLHKQHQMCWSSVQPIPRSYVTSSTAVGDIASHDKQNNRKFAAVPSLADDQDDSDSRYRNDESVDDESQDSDVAASPHIPVLVEEVLHMLQPRDGQVIVEMTFGAGGHAREILRIAPGVQYLASDRDPLAYSMAEKMTASYREGQITPILSRFSEIPSHFHRLGVFPGTVDAFLFDLGASSMQFDTPERGFSLSRNGPLDMRMDGNRFPDSPTAADIVNSLEPKDLMHILKKYGEEKKAREIAHAIVEARYAFGKFTTTKQLADVVGSVFESDAFRRDKMFRHAHLATKTFQALRIFVNDELNEIHNGLLVARHFLKVGGRCAVISFHSLEDRIVKRHFHDIDIDEDRNLSIHDHFRNAEVSYDLQMLQDEFLTKTWKPVARKVTEPSEAECARNPRARSAKLRAAIKL